MKRVLNYFRELGGAATAGWNRFWFTAIDPATLGLIRICAGGMMLYTHLVWTLGIGDFLMPGGWLEPEAVRLYQRGSYTWSYWWWIDSPWLVWLIHLAGLVVFASLTLGLFSRVMSVLAFLITVSYAHRLAGAQFGLDQVNALLAMYLMIGPSGAAYSLDRWRQARRAGAKLGPAAPSVGANIALRLIQLHLCVIYFFAGAAKLQGPSWWEGTALWGAVANLEYQSIDLTWLVHWPLTLALCTHLTVFWEITYPALIWPRLTRPIVLTLGVPLHLGIAIGLGMIPFAVIMLIANLAFVSPAIVRSILGGGQPKPRKPKPYGEKLADKDAPAADAGARLPHMRDRGKRASSMA